MSSTQTSKPTSKSQRPPKRYFLIQCRSNLHDAYNDHEDLSVVAVARSQDDAIRLWYAHEIDLWERTLDDVDWERGLEIHHDLEGDIGNWREGSVAPLLDVPHLEEIGCWGHYDGFKGDDGAAAIQNIINTESDFLPSKFL